MSGWLLELLTELTKIREDKELKNIKMQRQKD